MVVSMPWFSRYLKIAIQGYQVGCEIYFANPSAMFPVIQE